MTELLIRLFIKDRNNINSPEVRRRYGLLAAITAISLNLILFGAKLTVGILANSMAIRADALNNVADAGASVVALISFVIAAKPADRKHPFGHARIEYITSMLVSFLILYTGVNIASDAIGALLGSGEGKAEFGVLSAVVLGISILAKLWLFVFYRKIGRKINSTVLVADSVDSLSDSLSTSVVLIAAIVMLFFPNLTMLDSIMSLIVSVFIIISGIKIFNETKNAILGEAPDPEVIENIKNVLDEYPEALGFHDMFVHSYGPGRFIVSLHVEVDGSKDVFASHDAIDNIEKTLHDKFGYITTIHMDPIVTDESTSEIKAQISDIAAVVDERIRIHDFRMVRGETHTNLIFDIAVPFEVKLKDDEIVDEINRRVSALDGNYFAVITVDRE